MSKHPPKQRTIPGVDLSPDSFPSITRPELADEETAVEVQPTVENESEPDNSPNILSSLKKDKPVRKSHSYYLRVDVAETLKKVAKKNGVTASELLEHILVQTLL